MENDVCPNCKYRMIRTIVGSALNYKCTNCGYGIATTVAEGLKWDDTIYTIVLKKQCDDVTMDKIKLVSDISGLNFLASKNLLKNGGILISDVAEILKKKIEALENVSINFEISPDFKY